MTKPFKTEPHGEHEVSLIEDMGDWRNRLYEIADYGYEQAIQFTGEEMESLTSWWQTERNRILGSGGTSEPMKAEPTTG